MKYLIWTAGWFIGGWVLEFVRPPKYGTSELNKKVNIAHDWLTLIIWTLFWIGVCSRYIQ